MALCTSCAKIPFRDMLKSAQRHKDKYRTADPWRLGRYGEVRARECPFCQLVAPICIAAKVVPDDIPGPPDDDEVIWVYPRDAVKLSADLARTGTELCFVAERPKRRPGGPVFARPSFSKWIDLEFVKSWIAICDNHHNDLEQCSPLPFNPAVLPRSDRRQLDLRLIDVDDMCIVYAPQKAEYVALSYVWGRTGNRRRLTLTSENEEALARSMALTLNEAAFPNTVRDAITVVRKLGKRYLWVDSLCLLQDDEWELRECVAVMDLFYEMATFTIIAAGGEDAFAGLEGVPPTKRRSQVNVTKELAPGVIMTAIEDVDMLIQRSVYNGRAWTMQEELLSRRLLIFIGGQVYWKCGKSYLDEKLNCQGSGVLYDKRSSQSRQLLEKYLLRNDRTDFSEFINMLGFYARRQLSFESDVLRAAKGMLRKFSVLSGLHCFQGLPPPLSRSMLFCTRLIRDGRAFGRRPDFPSYSWTGWKASPQYYWAIRSWKPDSAKKWRLEIWIEWHCVFNDRQIYRINKAGRLYKAATPKCEDTRKHTGEELRRVSISENRNHFAPVCPASYPLLFFWTVVVDLRLVKHESLNATDYAVTIGYIESASHYTMQAPMVVELDKLQSSNEMQIGTFAILASTVIGYWALLLKMENGIAERRGVAMLRKDVLEKCLEPGPRWEAIVMG